MFAASSLGSRPSQFIVGLEGAPRVRFSPARRRGLPAQVVVCPPRQQQPTSSFAADQTEISALLTTCARHEVTFREATVRSMACIPPPSLTTSLVVSRCFGA